MADLILQQDFKPVVPASLIQKMANITMMKKTMSIMMKRMTGRI